MKVGAAVEITALFPGLISTGVSGRPRSGTVAVTAAEPDWGLVTAKAGEASRLMQTRLFSNQRIWRKILPALFQPNQHDYYYQRSGNQAQLFDRHNPEIDQAG